MTLEELAGKLTLIKVNLDELLDNLEFGITGEIKFAPPPIPMKIRRKRRTKKEVEFAPPKEETSLPDADDVHPFYGKKKREKKVEGES